MGAWPLSSLRQSFLDGSLTRLVDPDTVLRGKIVEFVGRGELGLASGRRTDGSYERVWFKEAVPPDEVAFEAGVFLLRKSVAESAARRDQPQPGATAVPPAPPSEEHRSGMVAPGPPPAAEVSRRLRVRGTVPPEVWNRLGTKVLPKLRTAKDLRVSVEFSVTVDGSQASNLESELRLIVQELGLTGALQIE